jgi:hypothetical protein
MISKISPFANFQILSVLGELSRTLFGLSVMPHLSGDRWVGEASASLSKGQEAFSKVIDTEPNRRNRKFVGFFGDFKNFFQEFFLTNCINYINLSIRFGFYQNGLPFR